MKYLLLISLLCLAAVAFGRRYDDYKLVRVFAESKEDRSIVHQTVETQRFDVLYWSEPGRLKGPVDLLIAPQQYGLLTGHLKSNGMKTKTIHQNVQELFDEEKRTTTPTTPFTIGMDTRAFELNKYHKYQEIIDWLNSIASQYPSIASTFNVGTSYEKRQVLGIKIGKPGSNKKSIWIDGGLHSREWLADSTATWIIAQLTQNYSTDSNTKMLVDTLDWYIVVAPNPDGYEYSRTTNRMWRKTRSKQGNICYGVDPNRNFDFHWGGDGTSSVCSSEIYCGPNAFSEPECKNMSTMIQRLTTQNNLQAMITLHTFGQLWLVPYGYTSPPVYPPDYNELLQAAKDGAAALKAVYGTVYTVENSAGLYPAAGASDDWSKGVPGVKFVYTMELRDTGTYGFVAPASEIIPTAVETWAGIKVIANRVINL